MKRCGSAIGPGEEAKAEDRALHAAVWPGVPAKITKFGIRDHSISLRAPENLIFD